MTDEQVEAVRAALETLEAVAQDHDSPRFWELHRDFHWALLEPGASAWIQRVLDQIWLASQRYVRLFVSETVDDAMARPPRAARVLRAARRRRAAASCCAATSTAPSSRCAQAFAPGRRSRRRG